MPAAARRIPAALAWVLFLCLALGWAVALAAPGATGHPGWWGQMEAEGKEGGYQIIDEAVLKALMDSGRDFVLLDARPDYEFQRGHIPGAVNLEFHLGDRLELNPAKARALEKLLGPDHDRLVVIYCRSFRCLRGGLAARWAAHLGYRDVRRLPSGYHGWLEFTGQPLRDQAPPGPQVGDIFPDCHLVVLGGRPDRQYLGLPAGAKSFAPAEARSEYLLVEFYQEMCSQCLEEVAAYNRLHREIADDPFLKDRLRLIGLGVDSGYRQVVKFRRERGVEFPLFADAHRELFICLGEPELPTAYLLMRQPGGRMRIKAMLSGHVNDHEKVLRIIKAAMAAEAP